jgi:hypothetical protein
MDRGWFRLLYESNGLALDERIELLTNRCYVRSTKNDRGLFPYDDRYAEPF